jgi:hypothetical protein
MISLFLVYPYFRTCVLSSPGFSSAIAAVATSAPLSAPARYSDFCRNMVLLSPGRPFVATSKTLSAGSELVHSHARASSTRRRAKQVRRRRTLRSRESQQERRPAVCAERVLICTKIARALCSGAERALQWNQDVCCSSCSSSVYAPMNKDQAVIKFDLYKQISAACGLRSNRVP